MTAYDITSPLTCAHDLGAEGRISAHDDDLGIVRWILLADAAAMLTPPAERLALTDLTPEQIAEIATAYREARARYMTDARAADIARAREDLARERAARVAQIHEDIAQADAELEAEVGAEPETVEITRSDAIDAAKACARHAASLRDEAVRIKRSRSFAREIRAERATAAALEALRYDHLARRILQEVDDTDDAR